MSEARSTGQEEVVQQQGRNGIDDDERQMRLNFLSSAACLLSLVSLALAWSLVLAPSEALAHTDVTPEEARDLIAANENLIVIDNREEYEYCATDPPAPLPPGHIPGALNYPWNSGFFQENYTDFPIDAEILIVCRTGNRSNQAATFLDSEGYTNVYDMTGGMVQWEWETELCSQVPTMSPGGMAALMGLLLGVGLFALHRSRVA